MTLLLLAGCLSALDSDSGSTNWGPHSGGEVSFENPEGESLSGDFYPAALQNRPSILMYGDYLSPRSSVPPELIKELTNRDWNVLVMDVRGSGDLEGLPIEGGDYDVESAIQFLLGHGGGIPAVVGGSHYCFIGMFQAYKASTLQDRTQIPAYAMLPFDSYGVCDSLLPEFLPEVPAFWLTTDSHPAEEYVAADRPDWTFKHVYYYNGYPDLDNENIDGPEVQAELLSFLEQALEPGG
jgi:hypothetical protein